MKRLVLFMLLVLLVMPLSAQEADPLCSEFSADALLYESGLARGRADSGRALRLLMCYVALKPNDGLALRLRGMVNADLGNYDSAMNDYNQSLLLDADNPVTFNARGLVALKNNWVQLAFNDFDRAIQLDPGYALAYNNRGYAYQLLGNVLPAANDFQKAIDLGHDPLLTPRWNMALLYEKAGDEDGLEKLLYDIIQTEPDYAPAYDTLAALQERRGDPLMAQRTRDRLRERQISQRNPNMNMPLAATSDFQATFLRYLPSMLIALLSGGLVGGLVISRWRRQAVA